MIQGAIVSAKDNISGRVVNSAPTGADGRYVIRPIQGGHDHTMSATYLDYGFDSPIFFLGNDNDGIDLNTYIIAGFVTRYNTDPPQGINDIKVNIKKGDTVIRVLTTGNRDGNVSYPGYYEGIGLGPGTYSIEAVNP